MKRRAIRFVVECVYCMGAGLLPHYDHKGKNRDSFGHRYTDVAGICGHCNGNGQIQTNLKKFIGRQRIPGVKRIRVGWKLNGSKWNEQYISYATFLRRKTRPYIDPE